MLRSSLRRTIAFSAAALLASSLVLSGCGRTPTNPDDAGGGIEEPGEPGGEEPGEEPLPFPGGGGTSPGGGGVVVPAPQPGTPATPGKPTSTLKPLPKPTPIPPYKAPASGGSDPEKDLDNFVGLLRQFGYEPGTLDTQNVRLQLAIVNRVPAAIMGWVDSPASHKVHEIRAAAMGNISYEAWKSDGLNLARRPDGYSWYVGRRALYRDILFDRFSATNDDRELIFYKRLNRTNFFVSYRANGQLDDYGFFIERDWRNFIGIPASIWQ